MSGPQTTQKYTARDCTLYHQVPVFDAIIDVYVHSNNTGHILAHSVFEFSLDVQKKVLRTLAKNKYKILSPLQAKDN